MDSNFATEVSKGNIDFRHNKKVRRITYTCHSCVEHFNFDKNKHVTFSIWQVEKAPSTNKLHIQGYLELDTPQTYKWIHKHLCKHATLFESKGTSAQNIKYCSKEESRALPYTHRYGEPKEMGKRNDFTDFMEDVMEDPYQDNLNEKYPALFGRYSIWANKTIEDAKFKYAVKHMDNPVEKSPNDFQKEVLEIINQEPDKRKIYIYVDYQQGIGKSTLTEYLILKKGAVSLMGSRADMAYAWKGEKIVIVDQGKESETPISWQALEEIKNGMICSTKYESRMKVYKKPHVLVFMNKDIPPSLEKNNYGNGRWIVKYYGTPE